MIHKSHILILLFTFFQVSSNNSLYDIENLLNEGNTLKASELLTKTNLKELSNYNKAKYYYLKAEINLRNNKENLAYRDYLLSKSLFLKCDSIDKAMNLNIDIAYLISAQKQNTTDYSIYIKEFLEYAVKKNDTIKIVAGYGTWAMLKTDEGKYNESKDYYLTAVRYLKKVPNPSFESVINNNLANLYNVYLHKPDSAIYYLEKDYRYIKLTGSTEDFYHNYINRASSYYYKRNYIKSIIFLKKADSLPLTDYKVKSKQYIYEFLQINYDSLKDYKNAYKYALLAKKFADSVNVIEQNIAINDIQTKYQTREKELENEVLKGKVKTNKALVYIVVGLLIVSLIIGFLIVKNARRREHISKQEKLIEQQKLEKALKEYELSSIDLMLEGQEKERQRIANDLHDNLGSMLATLKMNFEHLRLRKNELRDEENKLYDRTDELIEEAYQKVRRLAHAKNAGVFANEGLIPAIRKMAEKISIPGKLSIEVMAVGFNKRLENTIEIAIFRMVQELSTNIIKHSQATEASIQLTNHDENINIIIEDNGMGFPPAKTHTSDGMGLNTIRKKVEQLGGTFTIDSTPGKGTTIIIDLPI